MVNLVAILFKEFRCVRSFKLKTSYFHKEILHVYLFIAKFKAEQKKMSEKKKIYFNNFLTVINKDMIK